MRFGRYAIYYTCPPGALARFGADWLGWDAASGTPCDPPAVEGLPMPAHEITATPRKYGLHGTIKPPFRLAEGQDAAALSEAFDQFCATTAPATCAGLELTRLGSFLALTPTGDTSGLRRVAGAAVAGLDAFRAPLSEADLERRRAARLSPAQDALLLKWGYPYVMEEFRFHITLSGKLPRAAAETVQQALRPHLAPLLPQPFEIDALTLCGEDDMGRFHEIRRVPLSGA